MTYPAIRFVLRWGNAVALVTGMAIVLAGLWVGVQAGWLCGAAIVAAGLLAFLLLRTFAELVHIVSDTLLPPE